MQRMNRLKKEIVILQSPSPGISCWPSSEDKLDHFKAQIVGGEGTPYEGGVFHLDITIPDRYPFQPPGVQFVTTIYHPNVDTAGRICLDLLKMPPAGSWKPSWNLSTVLTSIQLLMSSPNPDDPLMVDIATEFKHKRAQYVATAKEWTRRYATENESDERKSAETSSDSDLSNAGLGENKPTTANKLLSRNKALKRVLKERNEDRPKKERL